MKPKMVYVAIAVVVVLAVVLGLGMLKPAKTAGARVQHDEQNAERWYQQKSAVMEKSLGKEHDQVMHAIIPFAVGGGLDLYYFPNARPGTAIATKELSEFPNEGPSNDRYDNYELVMFTRQSLDLDAAKDSNTPFGKAHSNINGVLNIMARYSADARLNANETAEFPAELAEVGGKCFIFDGYTSASDEAEEFGLVLVIEIFRSEMDYAMQHGGAKLIQMLKGKGYYPYSDLDRAPLM